MTGRHHADLIDGGELLRIGRFGIEPEITPAHFPGKHATPADYAVAMANVAIQEFAKASRLAAYSVEPPAPRARRRTWWFA